jgi:hypothetical protein
MLPAAVLEGKAFIWRRLGRQHNHLLSNRQTEHLAQTSFRWRRAVIILEGKDYRFMIRDKAVD